MHLNAAMSKAAHLNATDPTRFAVTGNDDNTQGGFGQLANYLIDHPLLSGNDVRVLLQITRSAESYDQVAACKAVRSKARFEDLVRSSSLTRPTLRKVLAKLERFGLISRHTVKGEARFKVEPGPWPMLGDRPQKGLRWREFHLFAPIKMIVRAWERATAGGVVGEETIVTFYDGLEESTEETRQARAEREAEKNLSSSDEGDAIERKFLAVPRQKEKRPRAKKPSGTRNTRNGLAGAREDYSSSKDTLSKGSSREPARPVGLASYTQTLRAAPAEPPINPEQGQGLEGLERGVPACIEGVNTAYAPQVDAPQAALDGVKEQESTLTQNKLSLFKTRYRDRLDADYDAHFGRLTRGQNAALRQAMNRFGEDHMLAALDWFFDNWATLKEAEGKFFANDSFPPLRVLFSFDMMDRWAPLVRSGKPAALPASAKTEWQEWVTSDKHREWQAETDNSLLDDIDLTRGRFKQ